MSRPPIPKEKYFQAIKKMSDEGLRQEEITPTRIQKKVGGQYSRCIEIVDEYFINKKGEDFEEPMPIWYRDFVSKVTEAAESMWVKVLSEMRNSVET